jgi:type IV pilus assembly protein PilX
MNTSPNGISLHVRIARQRGVVLFFALIALVAMSLAAVALIRSVDTGTLIAGNLAFKRTATLAGDIGTEAATLYLNSVQAAGSIQDELVNVNFPLNQTGGGSMPNAGYYSSMDPDLSLTDSAAAKHIKWDNTDSTDAGTDGQGNSVRYVIQRMCRSPGMLPATAANASLGQTDCLMSPEIPGSGPQTITDYAKACVGGGCPQPQYRPILRITSRIAGPKLTLSYVQAFVY